jgi:protein SCO1/2
MSVSVPLEGRSPAPGAGEAAPAPRRRAAGRVWASPLFWVALASVGLVVPLVTRMLRPIPPPLPVLATLPDFSLEAEDGRRFGSADLDGKVWLAGFIFTRCPTICPAITATMGRVQHRARHIEPGFRLVSISVDPAYDTAPRLAEYARRHKASPRMWRFLTGDLGAVKTVVTDGLKIAMAEPEGVQDFASIFHGTHFVLVDSRRRIRGYYDSSAPDVVDRVLHDAAMLLNRGD